MARMKRKDVLAAIRAAGYHGNQDLGIFLYLNNWVSLGVYRREFENGAALRRTGLPCDCLECQPGKPLAGPLPRLRPPLPQRVDYSRFLPMPPGQFNRH